MQATKPVTHTPGPWHTGTGKAEIIVYATDGYAVADAKVYHGRHAEGEAEANARLIAAAPDLLAALKLAKDRITELANARDFCWLDWSGADTVDAALARVAP